MKLKEDFEKFLISPLELSPAINIAETPKSPEPERLEPQSTVKFTVA
jgi:hypothetical protein